MGDDDRQLVARCLAGDQSACTALVDTYARMVGTVIWRATGDHEEVADLTQETLLRAFRALPYFDARARLSTWIYTIAHRVTIDYLRRQGRCKVGALLRKAEDENANAASTLASTEPMRRAQQTRPTAQRLCARCGNTRRIFTTAARPRLRTSWHITTGFESSI